MLSPDRPDSERLAGAQMRDLPHLLKMWALLAALVLIVSAGRIMQWDYPDPDDIMRLVQVRDLLAGQDWFDLTQHRIDPLRQVPMHWSRLVDLPLAIIIGGLTPLLGQAGAESFALIAVPLLVLLIAMILTGLVSVRLFGRETGGLTVLVAGMMPLLINQFQPLRIDHHGWQIACFAAALWGLAQGKAARGPIVAGLAMAWGMMISIETLPLAGLVGGIFALRWLRDRHERSALTHYLQALSAGLCVLFLATRGWPGASNFCDAIMPAHIGFFLVAALGTTVLRTIRPLPAIATVGAFGAIGAAGLALFGWSAPGCLDTPFGSLDPLVHDLWYVAVSEGRPVWEQRPIIIPVLLQLLVAFAASVFLYTRAPANERGWWLDFVILFAGTLVLGLLVTRSLAFGALLATIPLGWLLAQALHRLRTADGPRTRMAIAVATLLVLLPAAPVALAQQVLPERKDPREEGVNGLRDSFCDDRGAAETLQKLAPGMVFAPLDIGPSLLLNTRHKVVATGHHRAQAAMHDVMVAFLSDPDEARAVVQRYDADYFVLCTDLYEPAIYRMNGGPGSLAARLTEGDVPDWLEPLSLGGPETFRAYRVKD